MHTHTATVYRATPVSFAMYMDVAQPSTESWKPFTPPSDQERFASLASEHLRYLSERAFRLTRNQADAADLVQDTFERALKFSGSHVPPSRARNWLLVVMHNLFVDKYRANRAAPMAVSPELLPELAAPEPDEPQIQDVVTIDDVHKALTQVPHVLRQVFELREIEGRTYAEIAATLEIPLVTVGTRLLRARRHIKATLAGHQTEASAA